MRDSHVLGSAVHPRFVLVALSLLVGLVACAVDSLTPPMRTSGGSSLLPDLTISSITVQGGETTINDLDSLVFIVVVQNEGGEMDVGTAVSMYVNGMIASERPLRGLEASESLSLEFPWNASAGSHNIVFAVDTTAADTSFVEESNEANNRDSVTVVVEYSPRTIVAQDTVTFSALPSALSTDTSVQALLQVAADSGFSVGPQTMMIVTTYAEEGLRAYQLPLTSPSSPAENGTILTIARRTSENDAIYPYILHVADSTRVVVYNGEGGIRWERVSGVLQGTLLGPSGCVEGKVWPCVYQAGEEVQLPSIAKLFADAHSGSMADLLASHSAGGSAVTMAGFPTSADQLIDNPPTVYISVAGSTGCARCVGNDLQVWWTFRWVAIATDDRGPAYNLSSPVFNPGCYGGSHTFSFGDNAGQVVSITLTISLPPANPLTFPNRCHTQGAGG